MRQEERLERFEDWSVGLARIWLGALWGFAEATVFFIVPDVLITASALFSPRRSCFQMIAVLMGALLGGALMYTAADKYPEETTNVVLNVPFVKVRLIDKVDKQLQSRGAWAMCRGAISGVPYKIYAVRAPRLFPFLEFMAVSVPARLLRMLLSWGIGSLLGRIFRRQIEASPALALALLAVCWIGFYTYYWSVI